ncbi:hypothetical protein KIL84_005283 [Mauremys mutica]|uniref:Uncharacterized protein n=1 Tax=Mauremys mutica TaxID=74926 RepID=A0A9D4AYS8_9SAUR|nr:hypothetical protein KIL84_005283 [Mauremys mutica]
MQAGDAAAWVLSCGPGRGSGAQQGCYWARTYMPGLRPRLLPCPWRLGRLLLRRRVEVLSVVGAHPARCTSSLEVPGAAVSAEHPVLQETGPRYLCLPGERGEIREPSRCLPAAPPCQARLSGAGDAASSQQQGISTRSSGAP